MYGLSDTAFTIIQAVLSHYNEDGPNCKEFSDFEQFNLSNDDLLKYCNELENESFVIIEYDDDNNMYLYMTSKILPGLKK